LVIAVGALIEHGADAVINSRNGSLLGFAHQSNGQCPNGSKTVQMEVTAYTSGPESTGKSPGDPGYAVTASGTTAGPGTLAALGNISFGTRMYVPGYGWGTVEDRGGAIQGSHLDVWFRTVAEARRWGRQTLDVIVCNG
jgi:3D (Asp-Asp-Asp) domain-containing protein